MNWKFWNRCKHKFSKWVSYSVLVMSVEGFVTYKKVQLRQRRQCINCGLTQDQAIAYTNNESELIK